MAVKGTHRPGTFYRRIHAPCSNQEPILPLSCTVKALTTSPSTTMPSHSCSCVIAESAVAPSQSLQLCHYPALKPGHHSAPQMYHHPAMQLRQHHTEAQTNGSNQAHIKICSQAAAHSAQHAGMPSCGPADCLPSGMHTRLSYMQWGLCGQLHSLLLSLL